MTLEVNDVRSWKIDDPAPGIPLVSVSPVSWRAWALLARSKTSPILHEHFLQVAGAVSMLKGLDYHHDRFMRIGDSLAREVFADEATLLHEAVAYVIRVGQFHYFAQSDLVRSRLATITMPKIDELVNFRHKHSAHRSIDKPYTGDDVHLQSVHAMSLGEFGGRLWLPKEPLPAGFAGPFWGRAYRAFQLHTDPSQVFELVIERDHSVVMTEAYGILEKLLS